MKRVGPSWFQCRAGSPTVDLLRTPRPLWLSDARTLKVLETWGRSLPSLRRQRERVDCHDDPLRPRATRHHHETLPVRMYVVNRVDGAGVTRLQYSGSIHPPLPT